MLSCEWRSGPSLRGGQLCTCRITVPDESTVEHGVSSSSSSRIGNGVSSSSSADLGNGVSSSSGADVGGANSSGGPGVTTTVKAGFPVAVISGILLGALAVLGISRWQRQKNLKAQYNSFDLAGETEEGGTSAVIYPFVEAPGGVKGRKPTLNRYQAPEEQDNVDGVLASPRSLITLPPPYAD